jgi:transcriptional regulator with XRE-family HTH domain
LIVPRRKAYTTPVDEKTIGNRLREIRRRRGFTQAEIAEQLGLDQTLVSNYERGAARLHGALVAGFAKALRVSSDELLGLKPLKETQSSRMARLLKRLGAVEKLPLSDRRTVLKLVEGLVERHGRVTRTASDHKRIA